MPHLLWICNREVTANRAYGPGCCGLDLQILGRVVGKAEVANSGREFFGASNPHLRLGGRPEDILQIHTGPADRTCVRWKSDRLTLHAPAEPVEKLVPLAFDNHRGTSNTESGQ